MLTQVDLYDGRKMVVVVVVITSLVIFGLFSVQYFLPSVLLPSVL